MRSLLIPILFLVDFCGLKAQIDIEPGWRFSTNPTQYFFSGFNVSVERVQGRSLWGLDLSYRPAYCSGCEVKGASGLWGSYLLQNFWNHNYQAFTLSLYPKFYFQNLSGYFSLQPYWRHWWFNRKPTDWDNIEGHSFSGVRSERQDVMGIRILFGSTSLKRKLGNSTFFIDASAGPGIFISQGRFRTYQGFVDGNSYPYHEEKRYSGMLSIHFRLQLGLQFDRGNS